MFSKIIFQASFFVAHQSETRYPLTITCYCAKLGCDQTLAIIEWNGRNFRVC